MKKTRELLHALFLQDSLGVLPPGEWSDDVEKPDLVITGPQGTLGMEITEYHRRSDERARFAAQEAVLRMAHSLFRKEGPAVMVRVQWNANEPVCGDETKALARKLADIVVANLPLLDGSCVLEANANQPSVLPGHIDRVEIYRYSENPDSDWFAPRSGFLPAIGAADLFPIIERKTELAKGYAVVDALWLLIVFGTRSPSSWAEIQPEVMRHIFTSAYDRVFAVSYAPRFAFELSTSKHGQQPSSESSQPDKLA